MTQINDDPQYLGDPFDAFADVKFSFKKSKKMDCSLVLTENTWQLGGQAVDRIERVESKKKKKTLRHTHPVL